VSEGIRGEGARIEKPDKCGTGKKGSRIIDRRGFVVSHCSPARERDEGAGKRIFIISRLRVGSN